MFFMCQAQITRKYVVHCIPPVLMHISVQYILNLLDLDREIKMQDPQISEQRCFQARTPTV